MNRPYNIYHRYFPCRSCLSVENILSSHKQTGQLVAHQSFWRYHSNLIRFQDVSVLLHYKHSLSLNDPIFIFWGHIILILHRYISSSILNFVYDRNIYKYSSVFHDLSWQSPVRRKCVNLTLLSIGNSGGEVLQPEFADYKQWLWYIIHICIRIRRCIVQKKGFIFKMYFTIFLFWKIPHLSWTSPATVLPSLQNFQCNIVVFACGLA